MSRRAFFTETLSHLDLSLLIAIRVIIGRSLYRRIANVLIAIRFVRRAKKKDRKEKKPPREIFIGTMAAIMIVYCPIEADDRGQILPGRRAGGAFSPRSFLIPSRAEFLIPRCCRSLTSRFTNYARVAYLTDGICRPLLLCSFLREPLLQVLVPL